MRIENEEMRQGEIKYVGSKRVACGKLKRVGASIFGEGVAETLKSLGTKQEGPIQRE